jgi:tyrosyl-tRNA synthetase
VTTLVHGQDQATRAEQASSVLFGEDISTLEPDDVLALFEDVPSTALSPVLFEGEGLAVSEVLVRTGLAASKSEAVRLLRGGGIYVNNRRVSDERARIGRTAAIGGRLLVLRKGRRENHMVRIGPGELP